MVSKYDGGFMKKKVLIIVLIVGCFFVLAGVGLKLMDFFGKKDFSEKNIEMVSVSKAITDGEVGYYLENDNLVVIYNAKNEANNTVFVTKATFKVKEFYSDKVHYQKTVEVNKQVAAKKKIEIVFDNVDFEADELANYMLVVEVE